MRSLVGPHLVGFSIGGLLWLGSLAAAAPGRYAIWALAIAVDLLTGLVAYLRRPDVPRHHSHMPERFGLAAAVLALAALGQGLSALALSALVAAALAAEVLLEGMLDAAEAI